jgi:tetratricopeptide (TPR) repeat protein
MAIQITCLASPSNSVSGAWERPRIQFCDGAEFRAAAAGQEHSSAELSASATRLLYDLLRTLRLKSSRMHCCSFSLLRVFRFFLLLAGLFSAHRSVAADQQWLRVSSDHFIVLTDAGDKQGHEVAARFEQMHAMFGHLLMRNHVRMAEPIEIIAIRSDKDYAQIAPLENGNPTQAAAFFLAGEDRVFIVLNLSVPDSWRAIGHPFAHYWLNFNYPPTQPWFDEGFAEYFSSLYLTPKTAELGGDPELNSTYTTDLLGNQTQTASKSLTEILSNPVWLAWPDLFEMKNRVVNGREGTHSTLFYAQSWIFVHYLLSHERLPDVGKYFDLVENQRVPTEQAVQQAFGMTLAQLDKTVKDYFHSLGGLQDALAISKQANHAPFVPSLSQLPLPFSVDEVATSAKSVSQAEGQALIAEMALRIPERREKAGEKLEALVSDEKTETAVAHRALAWAHVQKGETDRAFEELNEAIHLNSADPWVRMGLALAAYHSGERGAKIQGLANMMESLHIVLQEFPDFAEAYDMLGWARLAGGGANAAIEAMKKAVELSPRNEEYQLRLARAYLAAKKFDEARTTLERLKQSQNPQIAQVAKKSLIDLPFLEKYGVPPVEAAPAQQSANVAPKQPSNNDEEDEDGPAKPTTKEPKFDQRPVKFLKATVLSVDCSKAPAAVLTVSQGGKTLRLRAADYKSVPVIGANDFSCGWKGVPVNVNYRAGGNVDGDLVSIEVH